MLLTSKKVAILGAGPVGLTIAKLLQQANVGVSVYERDKDSHARIWGGTLDLHKDSGQEALAAAGLLQMYFDNALPMGVIGTDHRANILFTTNITEENKYDNPEINRNQLRTLLIDSLQNDTVVWDRRIIAIKPNNEKWLLQFDNGIEETADMVIVANGGMSKVRNFVTDAMPEETGTFIIQGDVPNPEINCLEVYKFCNAHRLMTSFNGNLFVANPFNNGSLSYGVIFKKPEAWNDIVDVDFHDTDSVKDFLIKRMSEWDKLFADLFRATTFFAGLTTKRLSLETSWKTDRPLPITLIGDAAHLMPPFAGKGVNTGLQDAMLLSKNLTGNNFSSIEEAIFDYEEKMKVYAGEAQRESAENEIEMRDPGFSFQRFFTD